MTLHVVSFFSHSWSSKLFILVQFVRLETLEGNKNLKAKLVPNFLNFSYFSELWGQNRPHVNTVDSLDANLFFF